MCGCDCSPIRCPAAPGTDWSAYTWRWMNESSDAFPFDRTTSMGGPSNTYRFTRQIIENDRSMVHTGECACLWITPIAELLTNTETRVTWNSPVIGALQRSGQSWQLSISRWIWSETWWGLATTIDWRFDEALLNQGCENDWFGGSSAWTPFGWRGYGWGYGWGYGYGWGSYYSNFSTTAIYRLRDAPTLYADGRLNVFERYAFHKGLEDAADDRNWDDGRYWPSLVGISRIPRTGVLS